MNKRGLFIAARIPIVFVGLGPERLPIAVNLREGPPVPAGGARS